MVCRYNCSLIKGGDEADLNNYRGITLLSIVGKFFFGILLKTLNYQIKFLEQNQIGFRKRYQTSDHIFTISALIEHYVKSNKGPIVHIFRRF